jgi:hypothetical protein
MSTTDIGIVEEGPCPCGKGHIAKQVTTQDNPWSTADVCYSIECADCSGAWRLEHGG